MKSISVAADHPLAGVFLETRSIKILCAPETRPKGAPRRTEGRSGREGGAGGVVIRGAAGGRQQRSKSDVGTRRPLEEDRLSDEDSARDTGSLSEEDSRGPRQSTSDPHDLVSDHKQAGGDRRPSSAERKSRSSSIPRSAERADRVIEELVSTVKFADDDRQVRQQSQSHGGRSRRERRGSGSGKSSLNLRRSSDGIGGPSGLVSGLGGAAVSGLGSWKGGGGEVQIG